MDFVMPWDPVSGKSIHWPAVLSSLGTLILALLFGIRQWVLTHQSNYIIDTLFTSPPSDFWDYYGASYQKATHLHKKLLNDVIVANKKVVDQAPVPDGFETHFDVVYAEFHDLARTLLTHVINLVKKWDTNNLRTNNVVYRANVMSVHYFNDKSGNAIVDGSLKKHVIELATPYSAYPVDIKNTGVVALRSNKLTTSTEVPECDIDPKRKPIAFPFTLSTDTREGLYHNTIKGAPEAVETTSASYIESFDEVLTSYLNGPSIDATAYENLQQYYQLNTDARSILSLPMVDPRYNRVGYVLNIYRDDAGLLYRGDKCTDFEKIISPFSLLLHNVLIDIESFSDK